MFITVILILPDGAKKIRVQQGARSVKYVVSSRRLGGDVQAEVLIEDFHHEGQRYYIGRHSESVDDDDIILAINEHQ